MHPDFWNLDLFDGGFREFPEEVLFYVRHQDGEGTVRELVPDALGVPFQGRFSRKGPVLFKIGDTIMAEVKISIRNLYKSFGRKQVLSGVNLDVRTGESLVVIGGSGTGKSVLIKCIQGLLIPDMGSVKIDGEELVWRRMWRIYHLPNYPAVCKNALA